MSFYCVDRCGALFGATCRLEERQLERGLVQDPDAICGTQSLPYHEGGGGYVERFAAGLGAKAEATGKAISQTVLDELREDFEGTPTRPRGSLLQLGPRASPPQRSASAAILLDVKVVH